MNKKLFALPLTVAAMGLASCNKSWPTITDDKAKEIVSTILSMDKISKMLSSDYSGLDNVFTAKTSYENKVTTAGKVTEKTTVAAEYALNVDKNYEHETYTEEELSGTTKGNCYMIFKDGMKYNLNKITSTGDKESKTESDFKTDIKEQIYDNYKDMNDGCGRVYYLMQHIDASITAFKTAHDTYKDNKDYHFNYDFKSNDNTDSIQLVVDGKTPKGIVDPTDDAIYKIEKISATVEHGLVTNFSFEEEYKVKTGDVEAITYAKQESTYSFGSASVDNINLDDYYIEAY